MWAVLALKGAVEAVGQRPISSAVQDGDSTPTARARPPVIGPCEISRGRSHNRRLDWSAGRRSVALHSRGCNYRRFARSPVPIYAAPDPSAVATSGSGARSKEEEASDDEE